MSASGLLIEIPETLVPGTILDIGADWPGLYHGCAVVRLLLTATVIRIDQRGTALRILSHEFRDIRPALVARGRVDNPPQAASLPHKKRTFAVA